MNKSFVESDRKTFYSYDAGWEHTYCDENTGGFLVTDLARKYKNMSKVEVEVFKKEQEMGMKYASFGFQIEHLNEISGISSPDVALYRHGISFKVNGLTADFKRMSSSNNIYNEGKDAKFKKKADLVMFEFKTHFEGIDRALKKLSQKGIHGYYYFFQEFEYHSF